jgi:SulP family sulfate permease
MFERIIPAFDWIRGYKRSDVRGDILAGLTVAIMLVPQGMAYAMLAGLSPVVGLYASTIPIIVYALFGSSRHLAVGPVAVLSLLVFAACSKLAQPGSKEYITIVLLLTLMVGFIQFLLGLLRLGFLVNFVSEAVISGYTSAAALIIWSSQLKHLLGIKLSSAHSFFHTLLEAAQNISQTNLITLAIGLVSIALLIIFKKKFPLFPASILVVIGGTLLVYLLDLHRLGVQTVGSVPRGLPSFSVPVFGLKSIVSLLPTVVTISFVGYMESIAIAKFIAARQKYKIDPNQELRAIGLSNIISSFFSAYAVTGGFSRTAVNYQAGARTPLASIFTAILVTLTLLFFTPLFYHLPNAVLAAIITVAVLGLVEFKEAKYFLKVKRSNGFALLIAFAITLAFGVVKGILAGVGFSLFFFIWRSSHPHAAELGYAKAEDIFRDISRYPDAKTYPNVIILRVDASLYFANMKFLDDLLRRSIEEKPEVKWVVFDLSGVNDMDAVAAHTLEEIMENYGGRGINFAFAGMKGPVRDLVTRAGWNEKYGKHINYFSVHHALQEIGAIQEK